jgi:hypothetical protein
MTPQLQAPWKSKRTAETQQVEQVLRQRFPKTDAYRYNSASIRVRVIDDSFKGKSVEERDALVEPLIDSLPENTQADIVNLLTMYESEPDESIRAWLANQEFENPTESML